MSKKDLEQKDVFELLNRFAVSHGIIDEFGSYKNATETIYQSDLVQDEMPELLTNLYEALQYDYEQRLAYVKEALKEEGNDNTAGFNDYELAHIMNRESDS